MKWPFKRNAENPNIPLSQAIDLLSNVTSSTGLSVNATSVLSNPAVKKGVELLSTSVANLPLFTYKRGSNGSRDRAAEHPAYSLLKKQPSERYTAFTWKRTLMQNAIIYGNGFAWIIRDEAANPVELRLLDSSQTSIEEEQDRIFYRTKINDTDVALSAADVFHIRGMSYNGIAGLSLLEILREAFANGLALQQYANNFFSNSGLPSLIFELPPHVRDEEKIAQWRKAWSQVHQGLQNSSKPALLPSGSSITTIGGNNESSQFVEARELDLVLVADCLGVPPHKLGSSISTSFASLESENKAFLSDSLEHWLCNIEQEAEAKLLTEMQKQADSHFVEFERRKLLQIDAATENQVLVTSYNNGLLSFKELRQLLNKPTEKNLDDGWRMPANIIEESDEPEPEPQPPELPEQVEPMEGELEQGGSEDSKAEPSRALEALTRKTLDRLATRVEKAATKGKYDEEDHRSIFVDAIEPVCNGQSDLVADTFFADLDHELQAISKAEIPTAPERRIELAEGAIWNIEQ